MLSSQLLLGILVVLLMTVFHVAGLVSLNTLLNRLWRLPRFSSNRMGIAYLLVMSVLVIIIIHTVEAYGWAALYYYLGEFTDPTKAVYFSIVTVTTLGYGDITLSEQWQLLASFEAMGGLILFGASTAFLIEVMRYLFKKTPNAN